MKLEERAVDYAKEALKMHREWQGKIRVTTPCVLTNKDQLSVAYTPGVAAPCLEIQKDVEKSYEYTRRGNLVAVVTDGTAVLGLGDIGPEAGMPVMEGKCALFQALQGRGRDCPHGGDDRRFLRGHQPGGHWRAPLL